LAQIKLRNVALIILGTEEAPVLMRVIMFLHAFCLACATTFAQDLGNPDAGRIVAVEVCSSCHDVLPGEGVGPYPDPLPFKELQPLPFENIANTPGVTSGGLFAWLTTTHPTMPDIVFEDRKDLNDVIAYILSLQKGYQ
jgi:hypothetical protein